MAVGSPQAVTDEEALPAIVRDLVEIEVIGNDIAHPLGRSSIDAQPLGHFIERQPFGRFRKGVNQRQQPV